MERVCYFLSKYFIHKFVLLHIIIQGWINLFISVTSCDSCYDIGPNKCFQDYHIKTNYSSWQVGQSSCFLYNDCKGTCHLNLLEFNLAIICVSVHNIDVCHVVCTPNNMWCTVYTCVQLITCGAQPCVSIHNMCCALVQRIICFISYKRTLLIMSFLYINEWRVMSVI